MSKINTGEVSKKFASVSLPIDLAESLRENAAAQGRTMAAQIEHWTKLGRAVENVIPAPAVLALKGGQDAGEILSRVSAFLIHQQPQRLIAKLESSTAPRYGVDLKDPAVALRIDPDGTETRGRFDAAGNFVPMEPSLKENHHVSASTPRTARKGHVHQPTQPKEKNRAIA